MAADLDVALLEHVEQADLDALGQVGQLIDGEDAPVQPGHQSVVDGELVREIAAFGDPDGVDFADEIGDRGVRGGELLAVALAAVHPRHRQVLARFGQQVLGEPGDRMEGVVVDLRVGDDREPLVEQADHGADDPGLGLAALSQQDDVVSGQNRVLHLRQDGVLEPEDAGHQGLPGGDAG